MLDVYVYNNLPQCLSKLMHAQNQEILPGWSRPDCQKTVWTTLFFFLLVLNLFYSLQRVSIGFITEKTIFSTVQHLLGGPTFSRGVQMLISIES